MNIVLWGIFYIITATFLGYFLLKEKKVIDYIRKKENELLLKVTMDSSSKEKIIGNIISVIGIGVLVIFYLIVDKKSDPLIKIKNYGIYGIFILNLCIYVIRTKIEYGLLANLIMTILGRLMFNILDEKFYIYLCINVVLFAILIYLFRKSTTEVITEAIVIEEMKKRHDKIREITEKDIEIETRRKSSLGVAIQSITFTLTAIILVGLIQGFYIGNYVIPSGSMEPTILVKDRVFSNMVKYKFKTPKVGDIIAFKEPINNLVMYTKRITGEPGDSMQIISGRMVINDKESEILNRKYEPEGLFYDNKIYVPKKGDKVKLNKIIMIGKLVGETADGRVVSQAGWTGYNNGEFYEELTAEEFLGRINTKKDFKNIIGNEDEFDENDNTKNVYYTFTLKVEGREELVLPIMDLKYNDELFMKLLNGEEITLKDDYYMAMGDNTNSSYDSRYFGYVAKNRIKGELLLRWWPLNRMGILKG